MVSPNNKRHTRLRNWTLFLGGGLLFFRMVRALEALRKHVVYTMYSLWYIIYRKLNITPCYSLTNYPTERKEYYTTKFDNHIQLCVIATQLHWSGVRSYFDSMQ